MEKIDKNVALGAGILLTIGGLAGAISSWAGEADGLPFLVMFVSLPALAVWFGFRLQTMKLAAGLPALFGAGFSLPSFFINSEGLSMSLLLLVLTAGASAAIAAISFSIRPKAREESDEVFGKRAVTARLISIIGIMIFPQLLQPAAYHMAKRSAPGIGAVENSAAKTARIISRIMLGLMSLITVSSILIATLDAF